MTTSPPPPHRDTDRARRHTSNRVLERLDRDTLQRLSSAGAGMAAPAARLQLNASVLVTLGTALGIAADRRFLLLPAVVLFFLGQHALQGWCPPVPIFRRLGVRTQGEIERERMALKALRGDFERLLPPDSDPAERAQAAMAAVDA